MADLETITNDELRIDRVPGADAGWGEIARFVLTFNAYRVHGSHERLRDVLENASSPPTLTELRTALFFEQRRWRHFGIAPVDEEMPRIRAIVGAIRERVVAGETA